MFYAGTDFYQWIHVEDHAAVGPNTEKSWLALAVQS